MEESHVDVVPELWDKFAKARSVVPSETASCSAEDGPLESDQVQAVHEPWKALQLLGRNALGDRTLQQVGIGRRRPVASSTGVVTCITWVPHAAPTASITFAVEESFLRLVLRPPLWFFGAPFCAVTRATGWRSRG